MSIEAAIENVTKALAVLTEAVNKQNDLSERMIGLKADAIETVKQTAAKPDASPKADKAPKETKTEAAAETQKAADKTDAAETQNASEEPMDPIAEAIRNYVATGYDAADPLAAEERKARGSKVKEIFAAIAKKGDCKVEKHSDIPEKFHGAFLKTLAARVEEGCLVIGKTSAGEDDLLGA